MSDLLFGGEVVHNVEELADFFGGLTLDHVRNSLATNIAMESVSGNNQNPTRRLLQEGLDVKVIGGEDNLKEHLLINRNEFLIPLADVSGTLASLVLVRLGVGGWERLAAVVLAVLKDL